MRGLLILAGMLVAVWLWRSRSAARVRSRQQQAQAPAPQEMLQCLHCGAHMPAADAVPGRQGAYCCAEHLSRSES